MLEEKEVIVTSWESATEMAAIMSSKDNIVGNVSFKWNDTEQAYIVRWKEKTENKVNKDI